MPSGTADFTTRVVALTPKDRWKFNGTVLVEWLNVSGGIDAPAVWMMAHREVLRAGYAYVMVSAQKVGVDGGASLMGIDMSLKAQDATRYASLSHPGDAYAYDMFSQVGGLLKSGALLAELHPQHVVALGESQSAMFLTTYVNAVDPLAKVYDGFLVHSRFGPCAPLDGHSLIEELNSPTAAPQAAVKFRRDLRVPVITVITETDLFGEDRPGYYSARQPDNEWLRVWEIPGTAHADNYTIQVAAIDSGAAPFDDLVAAYAPTKMLMGQELGHYINFAPQHHYVVQAAIAALTKWVATGEAAPSAGTLEVRETEGPQPIPDRQRRGPGRRADAVGGCAVRADIRRHPPEGRGQKASWPSSSAAANPSTPPRWAGSTRAGPPSTWNDSRPRSTARSDPGSSSPPTAPEILELAAATYPGN